MPDRELYLPRLVPLKIVAYAPISKIVAYATILGYYSDRNLKCPVIWVIV